MAGDWVAVSDEMKVELKVGTLADYWVGDWVAS